MRPNKRLSRYVLFLINLYSPCQDVDNNSASHHKRHQGTPGLGVDGAQQHHHGDQAGHGDLSKHSSRYLIVGLQQSKRGPVGFGEVLTRGHCLWAEAVIQV